MAREPTVGGHDASGPPHPRLVFRPGFHRHHDCFAARVDDVEHGVDAEAQLAGTSAWSGCDTRADDLGDMVADAGVQHVGQVLFGDRLERIGPAVLAVIRSLNCGNDAVDGAHWSRRSPR